MQQIVFSYVDVFIE